MTEIHTHIVYGVDDGPETFEDATAMIDVAYEQGVRQIICTSHATPAREPFPTELYERHLSEERAYIQEKNYALTLTSGSEILWYPTVPRLLGEGKIPTLNGTKYALVEFNPTESYEEIVDAALHLSIEGFLPLFAHVERYQALRKKDRLRELRDRYGVIAQMNTSTVIHGLRAKRLFDDKWPKRMLELEQIDVIASDAHNTDTRRCRMKEAYDELAAYFGADMAVSLCVRRPNQIWNGAYID